MKSLLRLMAFAVLVGGMAAVSHSQEDEKDPAKVLFEKTIELTDKDPVIFNKGFSAKTEYKMEKGKTYRIDVSSKDIDPVVLIAPAGTKKVLAFDDDSGDNNTDSRLVFKAPDDGDYDLIVTSFNAGETGKFTIIVREPTSFDLLRGQAMDIQRKARSPLDPDAKAELRDQVNKFLEDLVEKLDERGKKINKGDARLAMALAYDMEHLELKGLAAWYMKLGKTLQQSDNDTVRSDAKVLEGAARRVRLMGNSMDIKGTTYTDKEFDWSKYKGKVVLVDFWATWCGPCVREIPRLKKLYAEYHDKGFDIVGISGDRSVEPLEKFMEAKEIPWVCLFDRNAKRQPMVEHYGIFAFPTCILIGRDGKVISMEARGPELERLLEQQFEAKKSE